MAWTQLYVRVPEGTTRQMLKRVDEHVQQMGGVFQIPPHGDGLPIPESDGTYQVRVFGLSFMVKGIIEHYGLTVEREVLNPD